MADNDDEKGTPPPSNPSEIAPISIEEEMRKSYLDYAMSVIVSRALPDVRDGLKPVHRRILYTMDENGFSPDKPYKKSARVVGDVMGKYHPHGNIAIYDALVRMAQSFSLRLPLIDGQGNFGSVDGDPPAADRYTEARLAKAAVPLLDDLDKDTVDFQLNYSNEFREPTVLPAKYPNLLVNGSGGIAVGMATNMAPHNLGEAIDACIAVIDNPEIGIDDLIGIVPGPDFPTGGLILGRAGIKSAAHTGRGSVVMRARVEVEEVRKEREALIVTEIPYQVNKALMIERIAELVREKKLEGISDIRDESDRQGMRVVIELKRDAMAEIVLNQLYRFTPLQSTFGINNVCLTGGRPELLNLKDLLQAFVTFREEVVTRRTKFLLNKARDRAHVLVGLAIAVANIDEVIHLIRTSKDAAEAREALMARDWPAKDMAPLVALIADPRHALTEEGTYRLSEEQARAILDLRLQRLTALGRDEIGEELQNLAEEIKDYLAILRSRARVFGIIKDELAEIRNEFATPRRTEIVENEGEVEDEDLIQREDMVVTVSHAGYVKRVPLSTYRAQRRGGKGREAGGTREEDFVTKLFVASTHTPILFFSSAGMVYRLKVWRLPLGTPQSRGKALINLLPLEQDERITTILPMPETAAEAEDQFLMFATRSGTVRRNEISDFEQINRAGKIAMKLDDGDMIAGVEVCTERDDVLLTTAQGQCIRFPVGEVRVFKGRDSTGVRGIRLEGEDHLISMSILRHVKATPDERAAFIKMSRAVAGEEQDASGSDEEASSETTLAQERFAEMSAAEQVILTVSANGYGKRTSSYEYRITGRGGKGIVAMAVNERNGPLVASFPVEDADQIMLVTDGGQLIRTPVNGIRKAGRSTQGVIIINAADDKHVVSVEHITEEDGDESEAL
ncbi:MAG: DNA gyrase subunit A [Aestuariivirga sp.]|uniref:DNA gyrase subunit A n=1 Tax=Aestuariivirga sp. TaxID=2650926 RepID=UPI0025C0559B|nr:DNA gyrase subunit A [Aestuariivirga sp.]MCA3562531.1 DNA gyrase subunit A [Aestuariivirga sp.]